MDFITLVIIAVLVFLTGLLFAPLGLGGGLLFVPILHYVGGLPINSSTLLISLSLTTMTSFGSGLAHKKLGLWNGPTIKKALSGAVPGSVVGVGIVTLMGKSLNLWFKALAMILIFWAIWKISFKIRGLKREMGEVQLSGRKLIFGASIGGMLSAILAMGSGAIYVPIYRTYAGLEHRMAIGSSYATMMVVIPVAFITHSILLDGVFPDLQLLLILPLSVLIGAMVGAKVGMKFSENTLMWVFVLVLGFILLRYLVDLVITFS